MTRNFYFGLIVTLLAFIAINLIVAHQQSDCGISAVIGLVLPSVRSCADDIVRIGFPFLFFEQGGFAFRSNFNAGALLAAVVTALGASVIVGLIAQKLTLAKVR